MSDSTKLGLNRTGMKTAPLQAPRMLENEQAMPSFPGGLEDYIAAKAPYLAEKEVVGSVPPPASLTGAVKAVAKMLTGERTNVLIDRLGQRLAFERTGVRLYEQFIQKVKVFGSWPGGPTELRLREIQAEEHEHFLLVAEILERLGGDPTAMTPAADASAVASQGVLQVLSDPRMDLRQSLEALLTAELVDNDAWDVLIDLTRGFGQEEFAARFEDARAAEDEHLADVRQWLRAADSAASGVDAGATKPTASHAVVDADLQ